MAQQVDQESPAECFTATIIRKELPHIKEIAGNLLVKCGNDSSGAEVGERRDAHLDKAESLLQTLRNSDPYNQPRKTG
jgi:hypothetical protein